MDRRNVHLVLIMCFAFLYSSITGDALKIILKRAEYCNNTVNYLIKVHIEVINRKNDQFINGNVSLPRPLDRSMYGIAKLDYMVGGRGLPVLNVKENDVCDAMNRYLGEHWYDMARAFGIQPKKCPIPKGYYEIKNYKLGMDRIAFTAVPFGELHLMTQLIDARSKKELFCMITVVENQKE